MPREIYQNGLIATYGNMSASVLIDGESTKSFEVKTGVKQRCVVAPTHLNFHLSCATLGFGEITLWYRYAVQDSCSPYGH